MLVVLVTVPSQAIRKGALGVLKHGVKRLYGIVCDVDLETTVIQREIDAISHFPNLLKVNQRTDLREIWPIK